MPYLNSFYVDILKSIANQLNAFISAGLTLLKLTRSFLFVLLLCYLSKYLNRSSRRAKFL
jgi:hypothetical protein